MVAQLHAESGDAGGSGRRTTAVDIAPSGTWYYKVVAVDGNGNASAGSNQVTAVSADTIAPTAPTAPTATPYQDQVDLTWTAATDDTGVTGYNIYRLSSASDAPSAASLVGSVPTGAFTDTGVPPGTWFYKIVAFDAAGNQSTASTAVSAVTTSAATNIDFTGVDALAPTPTSRHPAVHQHDRWRDPGPADRPRLIYRGAGDFTFGTTFPDTLLYQPTSRYPHTWGSPSAGASIHHGRFAVRRSTPSTTTCPGGRGQGRRPPHDGPTPQRRRYDAGQPDGLQGRLRFGRNANRHARGLPDPVRWHLPAPGLDPDQGGAAHFPMGGAG